MKGHAPSWRLPVISKKTKYAFHRRHWDIPIVETDNSNCHESAPHFASSLRSSLSIGKREEQLFREQRLIRRPQNVSRILFQNRSWLWRASRSPLTFKGNVFFAIYNRTFICPSHFLGKQTQKFILSPLRSHLMLILLSEHFPNYWNTRRYKLYISDQGKPTGYQWQMCLWKGDYSQLTILGISLGVWTDVETWIRFYIPTGY